MDMLSRSVNSEARAC